MTCKIAGLFFYCELCTAFRNKHLALRSLNPSDRRCYDLYFFILGLHDLFLPPRSLFLFWIHGTLAKKLPAQLGMLPTCVRAGNSLVRMFHPCRDFRHPNPRLLCANEVLKSSASRNSKAHPSSLTTCSFAMSALAPRRVCPSIALWLTTTASA